MKEIPMDFKNIRPFEVEPFKGVDLNMLFRVDVQNGRMPGYGPYIPRPTLTWATNNPTPDKPNKITLIDIYEVFTPALLESAAFKVELAKWFNGLVDDILETGEGSWATGMVRVWFSEPQPYGSVYQPPYPGFGMAPPPFGAVPPSYGPAPQPFVRNPGDIG